MFVEQMSLCEETLDKHPSEQTIDVSVNVQLHAMNNHTIANTKTLKQQ